MKKISLLLVLSMIVTTVPCQEKDTVNLKKEKKEIKRRSYQRFVGHWDGLDIGLSNFLNKDNEMALPADGQFMELNTGKSWNVSVNAVQYDFGLITSYVGFVSGLGIEFNNCNFENRNSITKSTDGIIISEVDPLYTYDKSKFVSSYLTIPLLLEFQIPNSNMRRSGRYDRIHLSAGVIGAFKLFSYTKVVYKRDGNKEKDKKYDDFNLSPLRYGLTARIGYKSINLFANYNVTQLFEKNKGPEIYPFSIGLSLIDF